MKRLNLKNLKIGNHQYIDIHTHKQSDTKEVIAVQNKFIDDIIIDNEPMNTLFSVGLHPWHIGNTSELAIMTLNEIAKLDEVIAVGETGLDKNIDHSLSKQIEFFQRQIVIAESVNKPVIIHCVKSYSDLIKVRKDIKATTPWIIHGFNCSLQTAEQLIAHDCYLSFGKLLLNENSSAYKVFPNIDKNKIFLETDEREHSICDVYKKASQLLDITEEELKSIVKKNFERCFGIG